MTAERGKQVQQPAPAERQFVPKEAYEELSTEYVILRLALKDCLHQAGIPSNPGWSDLDIVASVAQKLGVQNRYQDTAYFTRRIVEIGKQQNQKTPKNP